MSAKQSNSLPTRKVTVGAFAGAISAILVWAMNSLGVLPDDVQIPAEVAAAITTVLTFVVSYLVPPSKNDNVVVVNSPTQ